MHSAYFFPPHVEESRPFLQPPALLPGKHGREGTKRGEENRRFNQTYKSEVIIDNKHNNIAFHIISNCNLDCLSMHASAWMTEFNK
jgi:hypothetical protein